MVKTKTKKAISKTTSKTQAKRPVKRTVSDKAQQQVAAVAAQEMDSVYILKLVLYLIIGSQWIRITRGSMSIPLPIGLVVGFIFARSERFQIDRKLEYAMLLMAMFIGFWVLPGVEILL